MLLIIASAIFGTGVGVAAHFAFMRFYPLHSSSVVFEIRPGLSDVRDIAASEITQDQLVTRLALTETVLLLSRDVLETAMRDRQVRGTAWFQDNFISDASAELVDDAIDELEEDLRTRAVRSTNLFELSWSTHEAGDVPIVLNSIANAYLDKRKDLDNEVYSSNIGVFRDQLNKTQRELEDLDSKMQLYIKSNAMDTLVDPKESQVAHNLRQISSQITDMSGQLSMAASALEQTAAKIEGTLEPTSEDLLRAEHDPMVQPHQQAVLAIKTELRHLYEMYHPGHAMIKRNEIRLRATEAERDSAVEEIVRENLEAQFRDLQNSIGQMTAALEGLETEYEEKSIQLRELAATQNQYESMSTQREYLLVQRDADLQLIKEVRLMQLRSDAGRVRLAQLALSPREPSFPQPEVVIPLGALLVVALTVGMIFLRELTDHRVKSASDLAVLPGAQIIGIIPERTEDPTRPRTAELVVRRHPQSVLAESYRQAFASLTKSMDRAGHQSLLVVGGLPGAGTSTVSTNLAATWAASGRRVLVVDANFRRPRLAEALGAEQSAPGLGDVLAGTASIDDAVFELDHGISLMPAGSPANRIYEALNTRQFDSLQAELRDRFDLIIFDAPPAVVAGEALSLANRVDAAMLVVRAGKEQRGLVGRLIGQLSDAHCDLLGVVLNRPRGTAGGYFKKNYAAMAAYSADQES
jgi:capsular exopolysaccharide synthesis family protein